MNVVVFLAQIGTGHGGLESIPAQPDKSLRLIRALGGEGQWYRLLTWAFMHDGLLHIGSNMVVLYFLGRLLEPAIGTTRFSSLYWLPYSPDRWVR